MSTKPKFLLITQDGKMPAKGLAPAVAAWAKVAGYEVEIRAPIIVPERPVPMLVWYDDAQDIAAETRAAPGAPK